MPSLKDFLFGSKEKIQQVSQLTPEQQQMQNQLLQFLGPLLGQGSSFLSGLLDSSKGGQEAFAAPYMRQFQEEILPGIAERFSAMDGQSSSAFGQQLGKAGSGLQEQLASLQGNLGIQGMQSLMQMLGLGQQKTQETLFRPATQGFLGNLGSGLGGGLGQGLGAGLGGMMGGGSKYLGGLFS